MLRNPAPAGNVVALLDALNVSAWTEQPLYQPSACAIVGWLLARWGTLLW